MATMWLKRSGAQFAAIVRFTLSFWVGIFFLLLVALLAGCDPGPVPLFSSSTPAPSPTPLPFPASVLQKQWGLATSVDECNRILQTAPTCRVYAGSTRLQQPAWQQLFPKVDFYLIQTGQFWQGYERMTDGGGTKSNPVVVATQDGEIYTAETFHRLLQANGITIAEENREAVAQAFALMTLPYYVETGIVFSDAATGDFTNLVYDPRYNYRLVAFTRLQGKRIEYYFAFDSGKLNRAKLIVSDWDNRGLAFTPVYWPQLNTVPYLPNAKEYVFAP